jgi:hypothetical protein
MKRSTAIGCAAIPGSRIARTCLLVLLLVPLLTLGACTARYSQSLSGAIPKSNGTLVSTNATGLTLFGIAITEPTPAHEQITQLIGGCERLDAVEVDYRETVFLVLGIPKVGVKATCVQ